MNRLPDYLRDGLDLVFVGSNPGTRSAAVGHYYAHPTNQFWRLLRESGLVPEPLTPADDARLLEWGIGLTDLVARPSLRASDLSRREVQAGRPALERKLLKYRPKLVCFNGVGVYNAFSVGKACEPGLQPERIGEARVYAMPSTSGLAAAYQRAAKLTYFRALRDLVCNS